MYDEGTRAAALARLATSSISRVSRETGISRSTLREWRDGDGPTRTSGCPRCADLSLARTDYAALLGYYLGDGCLSAHRRYVSLRVSCDVTYPGIVYDVTTLISSVRPGRKVFHVIGPGVVVVQSNWVHWPCLFPQHGPGRKHERPIVLAGWQESIVDAHPGPFLRGLFHSDGSRVRNWATRVVAGQRKRYDYPRWQFVNRSEDILGLCSAALDLAEIPWRRSGRFTISVSRRAAVAHLDELIGLKT